MIKIRNVEIGSGMPKICVPLSSALRDGLASQARRAVETGADLAEWRADFYDNVSDHCAVLETLRELRQILGETPLLFTFRTVAEGGGRNISRSDYISLCKTALASGCADLVDAELSSGENALREIICVAKLAGAAAVVSCHDFELTPPPDELLAILEKSRGAGADIAKLAVMPQTPADVLTLLTATELFSRENPGYPIITMAMGELGKISRISGGIFGSAVTFASLDGGTAPGQLTVGDTRKALELLNI